MMYDADWYKLFYCRGGEPNTRGSYLFIIRKAIFLDRHSLLWATENTARPNLYPSRHTVHPQTSQADGISLSYNETQPKPC